MTPQLRLPELPFQKITLSNGLDVIALKTGLLPIVAVNLWYHVGSKNEERSQRGFAHLFEHLMFEGSQHFPGDYFKPLQKKGAAVNGSTSPDRTNYFVDLPSAHVELAVAMESDRMANMLPALSDEKIRVQKDVVKNEYRQNYANRPYGQAWRILAEALYPPDHPYSWLTIGAMEDVERASRDDIESFFRRYYVPSNASLALVGDIEPEEAFRLAERYFGPIPPGRKSEPLWWASDWHPERTDLVHRENVELDRVYIAWPTSPQFTTPDTNYTLLADILGRGRSSRLYRRLVIETQIAQDVSAYQSGRELAGSFGVVTTLRPGREPAEAVELIYREIENVREKGVTEEELTRVKNGRLAGFVYALDNVGGFGGVADRLNAYNTFLGDPGKITSDFQRYDSVTREAIETQLNSNLTGSLGTQSLRDSRPRVTLTILGRKPPTLFPPLDRSIKPVPALASPFHAPVPQIRTLVNGVPLWVIPRRDLPIVAMSVVLSAGASAHGPDRAGLANLTADVLDEGTTSRDAATLALAAENLGTSLTSSCGWDGSYVGMQCLAPYLNQSLDLAVDILLNPTFPQPEFDRMAARTLASLRAEHDSAEQVAYRAFLKAVYAETHPYGRPSDGDESSVSALTREDLEGFHRHQYRPDRAAIVVAGSVEVDEITALLNARLSDWKGQGGVRAEIPVPSSRDRPKIVLIDRPGAPQAVVRVGHSGPPRSTPDHDALMVFNQILGGQFTSRLNAKLREEKGFTYGVRSHFDTRRGPGPFSITASLQADKLAEALEDLRGEVLRMLDDRPPSADELDDARRALIEGQARHFENPSALVSRYAGLFLYGFPPDHHARLAERYNEVTLAEMSLAAERHIRPSSFVYVVVADAESVSPSLEALSWADFVRG